MLAAIGACGRTENASPSVDGGANEVDSATPSPIGDSSAATPADVATPDANAIADVALDGMAPDPACERPKPDASGGAIGPTSDCLDRIDLGVGKVPYYRSHGLDGPHPNIRNLVLVQHGNSRNPWEYYDTIASLAKARDPVHTAVIAPHFQTSADVPPAGDLYWSSDDWKSGLTARNGAVESYAALDALLVAAKKAFPQLVRVTVLGFSAGGQTLQRYAAGSVEQDRTPGILTRFVIGSPGSYLYLDGRRLKADIECSSASSCAVDAASFDVPDYAPGCTSSDPGTVPGGEGYDDYKFGLANRAGYLSRVSDADLKVRLPSRQVVYLLAAGDSDTSAGTAYSVLDKECPAMVQGPVGASFRLQRGLVFHKYITLLFGAAHRVSVVPTCKHDEACVFASVEAGRAIFEP